MLPHGSLAYLRIVVNVNSHTVRMPYNKGVLDASYDYIVK